jgi:leucyl-tRNA synthetase
VIDEDTGAVVVVDAPADDETRRLLHRTIAEVREDMATLGFNTAVAKLITLNNRLTQVAQDTGAPREVVEPLVLMLAPLAPHAADELWSRLGHADTLTFEDFPTADPTWLVVDTVEVPVQVNGKVRGKVVVAAEANDVAIEEAARAVAAVAALLDAGTVRKVVVVPGRLINFVVS